MTSPSPAPQPSYAPRPTGQIAIGCVVIPLLLLGLSVGAYLYLRTQRSTQVRVPPGHLALVRALPGETAPVLARFGAGTVLEILGRSADWRWLEVVLWGGRRGWMRRPLEVLPWTLQASPSTPVPPQTLPAAVIPFVAELVFVPATSFTMGSPAGLGRDDERPAHVVHLSAFAIDRTEVTLGQYWPCVAAHICPPPTSDAGTTLPHYLNDPAFDNHPVVHVSWEAAQTYCRWRGMRLPTEAEWERAAGWDAVRKAKWFWPWGNEPRSGPVNIGETSLQAPGVVGSFAMDQSPAGVMDLGGNVSEWVFDWYKVDAYRVAESVNPTGPPYRRGAGSGRVVRGGAFSDGTEAARTTQRQHREPEYGYATVGFRCVREVTL
ncbi:MAG: SUMF1/EgtB/PvdO family nonheme iron enzyme [Candidatus Tectimicrobiota bacterium]